jgi:hypothetical protein
MPDDTTEARERLHAALVAARRNLATAIRDGDVVVTRRKRHAVQILTERWEERFADSETARPATCLHDEFD